MSSKVRQTIGRTIKHGLKMVDILASKLEVEGGAEAPNLPSRIRTCK